MEEVGVIKGDMRMLDPAKQYTSIAERDADVSFQIEENINKFVRVKEKGMPLFGDFILEGINPSIWLAISRERGNANDGKNPKEFTHIDYSQIPEHMRRGLEGYIEYGWELGGFMYSILTNDLRGTVKRADTINRHLLLEWIDFCLGELPGNSWGSPEAVSNWTRFRQDHHETKKEI